MSLLLGAKTAANNGQKPAANDVFSTSEFSEATEYLLWAVEQPQHFKELFAAGHCITAAINCPPKYLLRAHVKPQQLIDFFFLNSFCYLMLRLRKTAANDKQQIRFFSTSETQTLDRLYGPRLGP